jgi:replicative DNA helicase
MTEKKEKEEVILKSYNVDLITFEKAVENSLKLVKDRQKGEIIGAKCRWPKINNLLGGSWQKGCQYVIGGQPGTGKTVLADILVDDFTNKELNNHKIIVIFWNFEMSSQKQVLRIISNKIEMTVNDMMSAESPITSDEYQRIENIAQSMKDKNIYFVDIPAKPSEIKGKIEHIVNTNPDSHIINILDHSLLTRKEKDSDGPRELIGDVSKTFMFIKKKFGCTNILFSQVKREVDSHERAKESHMPRITDLVWCSEMEHDADVIMFISNPKKHGIKEFEGHNTQNMLLLNIAKNRDGKVGVVLMRENLKYNIIEQHEDTKIVNENGTLNLSV